MPQFTVITDMGVHAWWYHQPTEHYFVPRALAKFELERFGVPSDSISITGIPILPVFAETVAEVRNLGLQEKRDRFQQKMDCAPLQLWTNLQDVRPVIMLMSTGPGTVALYKATLECTTPIIICVICGRQADIRSQLAAIQVPKRHGVQLLGFTKTIHELMAISDVIVTKPGGLITSESLACGLMMVLVDQYPGQEEWNTSMLLTEGAAVQVFKYTNLAFQIDPILKDRSLLQKFKRNAARIGRPDAARQVVDAIMGGDPIDLGRTSVASVEMSSFVDAADETIWIPLDD